MINVAITRNSNESSSSALRRFTKQVQDARVLNDVREKRYANRELSHYKTKKGTLERLRRRAEREKLAKLGKLPPSKKRR